MRNVLVSAALLLVCTGLSADSKYLIPIVLTSPAAGAFGSRWSSVLSISNPTDQTAYASLYLNCAFECIAGIAAGSTIEGIPSLSHQISRIGPGDFLFLERASADKLRLSLRVQDLSRQELTYGTEIPVVPLSEAFTGPLQLLSVPTNDRFRQMLRVYDFDSRVDARVEVTIYEPNGTLLASREVKLAADSPLHPGYVEIGWIASEFPMVNAFKTVRVQVRPVTPGLRFWAFISVTHNETQHLTVISPAVE